MPGMFRVLEACFWRCATAHPISSKGDNINPYKTEGLRRRYRSPPQDRDDSHYTRRHHSMVVMRPK